MVYMCMHVCGAWACMHTCGGQVRCPVLSPCLIPLRQSLLLNLEIIVLAVRELRIHLFHPHQPWWCMCAWLFHIGAGHSNSGAHACTLLLFFPFVCTKTEALYTKITGNVTHTHMAMDGTEARMPCEWNPKKYWLNTACLPRVLKCIVPLNFWVKVKGEFFLSKCWGHAEGPVA